jgi:hypothetical protein
MNRSKYIIFACFFIFTGFVIFICIAKNTTKDDGISASKYHHYMIIDTSLDYRAGKRLFFQQCASCHAIYVEIVGSALAGVTERWIDSKLLYQYIRNPYSIKPTKYIDSIRKKYPFRHPLYPQMSDSLIYQILFYINAESKRRQTAIP